MALGPLAGHMETQHGRSVEGRRRWEATAPGRELRTYRIELPTAGGPWKCPVNRCPGQAATRTAMQVKCFHWHVQDTVVILEEGNLSHPR